MINLISTAFRECVVGGVTGGADTVEWEGVEVECVWVAASTYIHPYSGRRSDMHRKAADYTECPLFPVFPHAEGRKLGTLKEKKEKHEQQQQCLVRH